MTSNTIDRCEHPALAALTSRFGDRIQQGSAIRQQHGPTEGMGGPPPEGVFFANTTEDVAEAMKICFAHCFPVIAHGAGTSLEGQLAAPNGGLSIDLSRMDRVLEINASDLDVKVEAGLTREALNTELRSHGLFFPLDPGANATLGGMAATRASGTNAVRYGTMREVTLGLTVVTSSGEVMTTGTRARKSAAGYDLTRLIVGSEGTLGIITELRLRVFGIPDRITAAVVQFPDLAAAVETVMIVMQTGLPMARIELLDELQMEACIRWSKLEGFAATPTLFLEFHGSPGAVDEQVEAVRDLAAAAGSGPMKLATLTEDRNALWKARHNAWFAARSLRPGCEAFATDACVPISRLPEAIAEARGLAAAAGLMAPIVGHVGDGNFHMLLLYDPADVAEREAAERLSNEIANLSIRLGGTATGEHGIGLHKMSAMRVEHDDVALATMAALKRTFDPRNILNPGKMIPDLG
jgi:D-lactate dehydrogenase (cytochrome)